MQYCIINNDIALLMHYRALLQMPDQYIGPAPLATRGLRHIGSNLT